MIGRIRGSLMRKGRKGSKDCFLRLGRDDEMVTAGTRSPGCFFGVGEDREIMKRGRAQAENKDESKCILSNKD